ncbi:MAG: ABC transporter permease [Ruminococcaceae bacterium]|nr:ABC transporter permease [Oscillospiraceae bacterium]
MTKIKNAALHMFKVLWQPFLAIFLGLIVGAIVILIVGHNPITVYITMFQKSFFTLHYLLQSLTRSVPILVCSLAIVASWRAGYINLGVEGQMTVGSFVGTLVAVYMPGPTFVVIIAAVLCGMMAGAAYSLFAAFIYDKFNVSIVISTLMMNYIATYITTYFITFSLRDTSSVYAIQTKEIAMAMRLPRILPGKPFNLGFFIAIALVILLMFVVSKTKFGYESKMTGLNPVFAQYGGVKKTRVMYSTMALSGAIAACAGMLEIFGIKFRFVESMFTSTGYAWTGLMAALISGLHPIGAGFTSIFLAGMQVGGQNIQLSTGIPVQVATLIQSSIILFVSVQLFANWRKKSKLKAAADSKKAGDE